MNKSIQENLARSLAAKTTDVIPFIPYMLQDFWALGLSPDIVLTLLERNLKRGEEVRVLDLACGKGAISVVTAAKFKVHVTGIDLMNDFIDVARVKAAEYGVNSMCDFIAGDINEHMGYQCGFCVVIFSAVGDVIGDIEQTLIKLKAVLAEGGIIIIDNYDYIDKHEAGLLFRRVGLELVDEINESQARRNNLCSYELIDNSSLGMGAITRRASELSEMYPARHRIFEEYVQNQHNEYTYIENQCPASKVVWCLKRI